MREETKPGPQIAVRQIGAVRSPVAEHWRIEWEVENRGEEPIGIMSARLPHGQFRSEEIRFDPLRELPAGKSDRFQVSVRCHEPSGLVTENAFLIFNVAWGTQPWRIFVRVRVVVDADGTPLATVESITTQKIGFSGVSS